MMAPHYMLDTNSVSYALRGDGRVKSRITGEAPSRLCVSAISFAELQCGVERQKSSRWRPALDTFFESVVVMPFTVETAATYALLKARLELAGTPLSYFDTLIAAHAQNLRCILVTHDRAFRHVPDLTITDWY